MEESEKQCSMGNVRKPKKDRSSSKHKSAKYFKNTTINRHVYVQTKRKQCTHETDKQLKYCTYNFKVLVFYMSIPIFCFFILLLHYNLEANVVLFVTPLQLFHRFS